MRSTRARYSALASGLTLVATLLLVAPAACTRSLSAPIGAAHEGPDEAFAPVRGGTLHLASIADLRGLDPAGPTDGLALGAMHLIFAGLVDYDDHARVVPDLADHWDVEDEGRTYRFVLRTGVTMHDGSELTASDVARSVERALHPSTPDQYASSFSGLVGYDAYTSGKAEHLEGVVAEGRYVVAFHLQKPDAAFPYLMTLHAVRPTCQSAGDRYSDTWLPCGAGPFKLERGGWQPGTSLRLVRHTGYFRAGLPYLDAVEWTFNMQEPAQRVRFERGDLDLVRDWTDTTAARFAADPRWRPNGAVEADTLIYGESMNTRVPPFDNVEIRRAVAAAIDREHYRLTGPARISVLTQALPASVADDDPTLVQQRYDYAAALEHMAKAGYAYDPATGKGGWPEPIDYLLYDQGAVTLLAPLLQQDLARIGLRLRLKVVSFPTFLTLQERAGAVAISFGSNMLDYPDPSSVFDTLFTTAAITPEDSQNTSFYSNARVDALAAAAHLELDPARRRAMYRQINGILCDEAPWAFTFSFHFYSVHQGYVRGYRPHPVWPLDLGGVWVDRAAGALDRALGGGLRDLRERVPRDSRGLRDLRERVHRDSRGLQ
jgi:ABC-type transport system substrate-binding protein